MQVDVIVVGAGVIGLSSTVRCADAGLTVAVIDPAPARGASWAAAGMLAPVAEMHYGEDALLRLNLASSARWPAWAAELADRGVSTGYVPCGSLMVARDADDAAELRRLMDTQRRLGLDVTWLRGREARSAEPNLAPSTRGAVRVDGDHQVDNRALVEGLRQLVSDSVGTTVVTGRVVRLDRAGERVTGVTLEDGRTVEALTVVLAAGAGSGRIEGVEDHLPEIRPIKGQLLHLRSPTGPLARANLRGLDVYIVNRPDGRIVVGATVEERGFDTTVTAGGVSELLRSAWELLPGIDECTFVEATAGLRPGSPDDAPIIGTDPQLDGLIIATGHYRNGVLLSPLTAEAVAAWASGSTAPAEVEEFGPMRFDLEPA